MRTRAFRRHQADRHLQRRLSEVRNQHDHNHLDWLKAPRAAAQYREQPKACRKRCCANQRKYEGPTIQERRACETH